jgi:ketosteroid isomerase-like protein
VSQENVKTVRDFYEAVNRSDLDTMGALCADDVVVDMSEAIGPDNQVHRGRDAVLAWWRSVIENWDSWVWEIESITAVPPDRVVAANRVHGRGRGSGVEVEARIGQLWRLSGGKVASVKMFQDEAEALEAARAGA